VVSFSADHQLSTNLKNRQDRFYTKGKLFSARSTQAHSLVILVPKKSELYEYCMIK